MKKRDLSAFGRSSESVRARVEAPKRTMSRITLSLPTPIADSLRDASLQRAVGYRAMIMDAVEAHGGEVRRAAGHPPGRTQVPLNLPDDDLLSLDRAANRSGVNRSSFVTECLSRYLDLRPTK